MKLIALVSVLSIFLHAVASADNCGICHEEYPYCACVNNDQTRNNVYSQLSNTLSQLSNNYPSMGDYIYNYLDSRNLSLNLIFKIIICFRCTILTGFLWHYYLENNLEIVLSNLIRYLNSISVHSFEYFTYYCSEKENLPPLH